MKLFLIIVFSSTLVLVNGNATVEEHYWRDFTGLIPADAIPGGLDKHGNRTYIGQFPSGTKLRSQTIPAVIKIGSRVAISSVGGFVQNITDRPLKILCTANILYYTWVDPRAASADECRLVTAGRQRSKPLYVGRTRVHNQVILGKVLPKFQTRLIAVMNETVHYLRPFKILAYCP